jgi:hypothetical protein
MLLKSTIAAFGIQGMTTQLELLLGTGQPLKIRDWMEPEFKTPLGATLYHRLRIHAFAANGDYADAREECLALGTTLTIATPDSPHSTRQLMSVLVVQAILEGQPAPGLLSSLYYYMVRRADQQKQVASLARSIRQEMNLVVLRGVLAMEEGDMPAAKTAFREALAVWQSEEAVADGSGIDFHSRPVAQAYLQMLE